MRRVVGPGAAITRASKELLAPRTEKYKTARLQSSQSITFGGLNSRGNSISSGDWGNSFEVPYYGD